MAYKSRCAGGKPVDYKWVGERVEPDEDQTIVDALARQFAVRLAAEAMQRDELKSNKYNKFVARMTSHTKVKLEEIAEGSMRPGSEVVKLAGCDDICCRMTELRWQKLERTLEGDNPKVLVRHYVAEPSEVDNGVFGLVLHRKLTKGLEDQEITKLQTEEINNAKSICAEAVKTNWTFDD